MVTLQKHYLGPEDETATGPNFPRQYEIVASIAPGQTIADLDLTDYFPDTMQFVDVVSIVDSSGNPIPSGQITNVFTPDDGGLGSTDSNDTGGDGIPVPGGQLTRRIASATGTGGRDVVMTVEFFIPRLDANGDVIIDAPDGNDIFDQNQSELGGQGGSNTWVPLDGDDSSEVIHIAPDAGDTSPDPADPPGGGGQTDTGLTGYGSDTESASDGEHFTDPDHVLEEQSIAIQKSVVNTNGSQEFSPGDVLEYTLEFQVSDYFAFEDVFIEDVFSDGQRFDDSFLPTLTFNEHNGTVSDSFDFSGYSQVGSSGQGGTSNSSASDYLVIDETDIHNNNDGSGNTKLTFLVSNLINDQTTGDGQLVGGGVPAGGFNDGGTTLNNNPPLSTGFSGTTGTIKFRTIIQDEYSDQFLSGDPSVDAGDRLVNDAIIDGAILDVDNLTPTSFREDDDTHEEIEIAAGNLFKSIYAINGQVAAGAAAEDTFAEINDGLEGHNNGIDVAPGDEITYRLSYTLMVADVEQLTLEDFFPLPAYDVSDLTASVASINASSPDASVPGSGLIEFGPAHTFGQSVQGVSNNASTNSFFIDFGTYDSPANEKAVVDLLVTVPIKDAPVADGLLFTNQIHQEQQNTFNEMVANDAIIQINLRQPDISLTKGVVAHSSDQTDIAFSPTAIAPSTATFATSPGAADAFSGSVASDATNAPASNLDNAPINSNLTGGLEAGDVVTFAITVENLGESHKGAFDVTITDDLPDGFKIPDGTNESGLTGINLQVNDGNGGTLAYTGADTDLFGAGIVLVDDAGADNDPNTHVDNIGAIDGYEIDASGNQTNTAGSNIAVITFDLEVDENAPFLQSSNNGVPESILNTASVAYANTEGGTPFPEESDTASVEVNTPQMFKELIATSEPSTSGNDVTIGEIVRYRLIAKIPEGTVEHLVIQDRLPGGLTFLDDSTATYTFVNDNTTTSGGITSTDNIGALNLGLSPANNHTGGALSDVQPAAAIPASAWNIFPDDNVGSGSSKGSDPDNYTSGQDVYFKFGDLTNSDRDLNDEYVVIEFNALVDNNNTNSQNDDGDVRNNTARFLSDDPDGNVVVHDTSNGRTVDVVEPAITIDKQVEGIDTTGAPDAYQADAGEMVSFSVTFTNDANATTAFDAVMTDILPPELDLDISSINTSFIGTASGIVTTNSNDTANRVQVNVDELAPGASVTVTYDATVTSIVNPQELITNTADVTYTSLPGDGTPSTDPNNPTGSDTPQIGGTVNSGDPTGERDGSDAPNGEPNDYAASDDGHVLAPAVEPGKSIVATSESSTLEGDDGSSEADARDVTIGEIVRYRLTVTIPEGTIPDFQIKDLLPDGLKYLNDGTTNISFVSNGNVSSSNAAINTAAASFGTLPPSAIADDGGDGSFDSGEDIVFSLGDIINTDNDSDAESVIIEFNAIVENIAANQDGVSLANSFEVTSSAPSFTAQTSAEVFVEILEPEIIDPTKVASLTTADADDLVDFTISFENTGSSTAFDVRVTDDLANLDLEEINNLVVTNTTTNTVLIAGTDYTIASGASPTDPTINLTIGSVDPANEITVTYQAKIPEDISPNSTIENTVDITYGTLPEAGTPLTDTANNPTGSQAATPGDEDGERNHDDTAGAGATNNYSDTVSEEIATPGLVPSKSIVATSENSPVATTGNDLAIGEVVRYRLVVQLPEGEIQDLKIEDNLPNGLKYLDDGSAKVALVADNVNDISFTSPALANPADPDIRVSGNSSNLSSISPTVTISATNAAGGSFNPATDQEPVFDLGTVTNNDNELLGSDNGEFAVIEFNAIAENILDNQAGVSHNNDITITYLDGDGVTQTITSPAVTTTIVEPSINNLAKAASVETADAGDAVTFTVTYTNTGDATAFDVRLFDQPSAAQLENIRTVTINSDAVLSNVNNISTDTEVDVTLDSVAVGETITITYVADLVSTLIPGTVIPNTADVTYSSLPGDGTPDTDPINNPTGSDAESPGAPDGERNHDDGAGNDNTVLNNYTDSASDNITINSLSIGSTIFSDTNNNGVQDAGELGISGVIVHLYDDNNNPVLDSTGTPIVTTTDSSGNYIFDTLPTGSYQVVIPDSNFQSGGALASNTLSSDNTDTNDNGEDGDDNGSQPLGATTEVRSPIIELIAGTEPEDTDAVNPEVGVSGGLDNAIDANGDMTVDFGFVPTCSISGNVTTDLNNDGTGDSAIAGVVLTLVDSSNNPVATVSTDSNGDYSFEDVPPGDYTVVESQPSGYGDVNESDSNNDGANDTDNEASNANNDNILSVSLAPGEDDTGNDFVEIELGSVSGQITVDVNNDDTGDSGLSGVTLSLVDDGGTTVATVVTDGNGEYTFADVYPGNYTVVETQPTGYADVSEVDGGDDGDNLDSSVLNSIPIVVNPGEDDTGNDFVEEEFGSVTGNVSASTSTGSQNLANVTIELVDDGGNSIASTTTDGSGNYSFSEVVPGNYTVVETQPGGYSDVSEVDVLNDGGDDSDNGNDGIVNSIPVIVDAGEDDTGNDFVETQNGSISGNVTSDDDNDDVGDTNLSGVIIELLDSGNNVVASTSTDASGNYLFADVTPGDYTVQQTNLAGYDDVNDVEGANDSQIEVTVNNGDTITSQDFVDEKSGSILGNVTADINNDDIGDVDLLGVTINLVDNNGNVIATTVTDANGNYEFSSVAPGDYTVEQENLTGYGDVNELDSNSSSTLDTEAETANSDNDNSLFVSLAPGESDVGNDFVDELLGSVSGNVTADINSDDSGDVDLPGVTINLVDSNGNVVATTVTDVDGNYEFSNVAPGDYTVEQENLTGYGDVADTDGGSPNSIAITVNPGAESSGNDFIDEELGQISGQVAEDTTGDGLGDTFVEGVVITLVDEAGNTVGTTTTDAQGDYLFEDLAPGVYSIVETQPDGLVDIAENDGGDDGDHDGNGVVNSITATVEPGEEDSGNDFVEAEPAKISGRVFGDLDRNGVEGAFEPGVDGVTVNLIQNGSVIGSVSTDSDGVYQFIELTPGVSYQVEFDEGTFPSSYSDGLTVQDSGNDDTIDSDAVPGSGITASVTPLPGEQISNIDAGLLTPEAEDLEGTASPDFIVGTSVGENIAGYKGQDTLTGGGGADKFFYNETSDGVDIITDFTSGEDQIILTSILEDELGYTGTDPIGDGVVVIENYGGIGTMIQIDYDQENELLPKDVVFLEGIENIDPGSDLVF